MSVALWRYHLVRTLIPSLLNSDDHDGDYLVELLLPRLWLSHRNDVTGNPSVDASMTLQAAYAQFGITAQVRCVVVLITNRAAHKITVYGRPDPRWDGTTFDGHCVLWLPQSGRLVDTTAEQFPEAQQPDRSIVFGRAAFTTDDSWTPKPASNISGLPDNQLMPVLRGNILLGYETTGPEHRDTISTASVVDQAASQYRRAGINLASHALMLLRVPDIVA